MRNPVLKNGDLENFTIKLKGQSGFARCPNKCGCNVYHKPDDTNEDLYKCNSCGVEFITE
ncbi:hypothetical protein [Vibrio crassostreae]|uniref:hypothetical protein n=1 Tax=Vibrio crassostreae TaxID=246167 RepID=UPI001B314244|nr:hypothetical protein [Vibrio crassostreae]